MTTNNAHSVLKMSSTLQNSNGSECMQANGLHTCFHKSASGQHTSHMLVPWVEWVTFEGEQQAIMRTRPLPLRPSYSSLVSVLSLYGITGGTELHQTCRQDWSQSTGNVFWSEGRQETQFCALITTIGAASSCEWS